MPSPDVGETRCPVRWEVPAKRRHQRPLPARRRKEVDVENCTEVAMTTLLAPTFTIPETKMKYLGYMYL